MTESVKAKQAERLDIRNKTIAGEIPKRVFIVGCYTLDMACGYAGVDLLRAHYDPELRYKAFSAVCRDFYSDSYPCEFMRFTGAYQTLGARNWVLSSTGTIQHPEIETMQPEDYDELIADPYGTIIDKLLPRVCSHLDAPASRRSMVMAKAVDCWNRYNQENNAMVAGLTEQHGYSDEFIKGNLAVAPFDFLADQLRGFKSVTMDCRRLPDKVEAAVKAITPLMVKLALANGAQPGDIALMPLHMAPYINMKTFERFYWPTFEELIIEVAKQGVGYNLFAEQDWTRYHEYLSRLPESTIIRFEEGEMKLLKETVGEKHVIAGFFDATITLTRSKEECIDEAKRILDTCAPGGRFYFALNKGIMDIKSIDVKKYQAVLDWLAVNATY